MAILSIVRGLSIAASFITAGQLASTSIVAIPSILKLADEDTVSANVLAKQFLHGLQTGKLTQAPPEFLSVFAFSFLAYHSRIASPDGTSWRWYAAAAVSMFSIIPWTLVVMDQYSKKIVSLAQPAHSHPEDKDAKLEHGSLSVPVQSTSASITPVEEFEPYDDAPFSGAEYEKMKVRQLLKSWNMLNLLRIVGTATAGACALAAVTTRVTLVTIVQGN